nr:tetratricopeptide repeat protein [uncultured Dongia sp.]
MGENELAAKKEQAREAFGEALAHFNGWRGREHSPSKATELMERAADLGSSEAMVSLGEWYLSEALGAPDRGQAKAWFQRAAEADDADGEFNLGMLAEEDGDFVEAALRYQKALDGKHDDGACGLARLMLEGNGIPQDIAAALDILELASSEYDSAEADYLLGVLYGEGKFVEQDRKRAGGQFYMAAHEGHVLAQMRYGESAETGYGDPEAPLDAYVWTHVALEHLPAAMKPRAEATLARIASSMTPETRTLADAEAQKMRFNSVLPVRPSLRV